MGGKNEFSISTPAGCQLPLTALGRYPCLESKCCNPNLDWYGICEQDLWSLSG